MEGRGDGRLNSWGQYIFDGVKGCKFDGVSGADGGKGWVGIMTNNAKTATEWVRWIGGKEGFWCRGIGWKVLEGR